MENELEAIIAIASPGKLVEMLYARALQDLRNACDLYDLTGDPRSEADAIHMTVHAQQIIAELNTCVNEKNDASDLAANLKRIYEYMQYRLTDSVRRRDKAPVLEVISLLDELHKTWKFLVDSADKAKGD